jgi:hypothetical protein
MDFIIFLCAMQQYFIGWGLKNKKKIKMHLPKKNICNRISKTADF